MIYLVLGIGAHHTEVFKAFELESDAQAWKDENFDELIDEGFAIITVRAIEFVCDKIEDITGVISNRMV